MSTARVTGKLGRLAPHPESTHPRLKLKDFLTGFPAAPANVDYLSKIIDWPMYGNDSLGDCTCAAAGHMIEAWTAYGHGAAAEVTDKDVLAAYEAVSGYVPGDPSTDQGANMQDVLTYWRSTGIGGHKIAAFAQLDITNLDEVKAALWLFGHVYVGINCPASAQDQFGAGQPWDVVAASPIEGGHAIDLGLDSTGENYQVVTWGRAQQMTAAFWATYVEEAWVVLSDEWISSTGAAPDGLDVAALNAAFEGMTGDPGPFPTPPGPAPSPAPVGLAVELAALIRAVEADAARDRAEVFAFLEAHGL